VDNRQGDQKTFTDFLREKFKGVADISAGFLLKIGLRPNMVTISGLLGHIVAAGLAVDGKMAWAGLVLLVMAPLDFLDGAMARKAGISSLFGAFLDSVTDRYSEFVILGGLLIFNVIHRDWIMCLGVYLAAIGSIMVSYIRARGEGLGITVKIGLLSRVERYIILIPGFLFGFPNVSAWIIAVLANFTALQRIHYVWRESMRLQAGKNEIKGNEEEMNNA